MFGAYTKDELQKQQLKRRDEIIAEKDKTIAELRQALQEYGPRSKKRKSSL